MTAASIKWTKNGGWDRSESITYTSACGRYVILKTKIAGDWTLPVLYVDGGYVRGYATVNEAKKAAAELASK